MAWGQIPALPLGEFCNHGQISAFQLQFDQSENGDDAVPRFIVRI